MMDLLKLKKQLYDKCNTLAEERIFELKAVIQEAQDAANNETKSSAGDKHETGRAMAQLETEKLTKQLAEALKLEQVLTHINPELKQSKVGLGSVVLTNNGNFYLTVSLGKIEIEDQTYFAISTASPIAQHMLGLTSGDKFSLNNRNFTIIQVA